jgi:hypothetical protein
MENSEQVRNRIMEKYYTPEINEFYDGFEFEDNRYGKPKSSDELIDFQNAWYKEVFKCSLEGMDLYTIKQGIENECIRVKYLDNKDLKDIGFKHVNGKLLKDVGQLYEYNNGRYFVHINYIRFSTWCVLKIESSVKINSERTLIVHSISIKNKCELIKLMKQLNVL